MKKNILFVLLPQYADWEAAYLASAISMLGGENYEIKTISLTKDAVTSIGGFRVLPDYDITSVPDDYEALILIGGMTWRDENVQQIKPLVKDCFQKGKVLGGICDASAFLGTAGVLNDVFHTSNDRPVLYFGGWKAKLVYFLCRIAHKLLKLLHLDSAFWYRKAKRTIVKYRHVKTKRVAFYFDPTPFTSIVYKKHIFPTKDRDFSGLKISFPGKVEAYLKRRYGDYMTLPPVEKRHNHSLHRLDFGPYARQQEEKQ